jgi:hypothetical protein
MGEKFQQERPDVPRDMPKITGNVPPAFKALMDNKGSSEKGPEPVNMPFNPTAGPTLAPLSEVAKLINKLDTLNYDQVQLPSKGRFYSDSVLSQGFVHIRPMTGSDEEILATPRYVKQNEAMDMLFRKCTKEQADFSNMISADRLYLLIWLRGISYGPDYEVEVKCPNCEVHFESNINLNELPVNYCSDNFDVSSLSGVLPKSGLKFSYRLATGKDENNVLKYRERRIKNFGSNVVDDTITYRTALLLNYIEDVTETGQLQILLKRLPVQDGAYIRSLVNEPPFGVDTKITVQCPMCSHIFDVDMPIESSFFYPRFKKKEEQE